MKISKIILSFIFITSCSASVAFGFVIGSSNAIGYPSFTSTYYYKPSKPFNRDEMSLDQYKYDVQNYQDKVKNYIEAANNDIQKIQAEKSNAINNVNHVIDEYNNYIGTDSNGINDIAADTALFH